MASLPIRVSNTCPDRSFQNLNPALVAEMREAYTRVWHSNFPDTPAVFEPTIEGAIDTARTSEESDSGQVLVTGSLYLVGGVLRILEPVRSI